MGNPEVLDRGEIHFGSIWIPRIVNVLLTSFVAALLALTAYSCILVINIQKDVSRKLTNAGEGSKVINVKLDDMEVRLRDINSTLDRLKKASANPHPQLESSLKALTEATTKLEAVLKIQK